MRRNAALVFVALVAVVGVVAAGVVVAGTGASPTAAASHSELSTPSNGTAVDVSGTGSVSAAPDLAVLRVSVVADATSADAARSAAAANATSLRDALSNAGVAADDVSTTAYRVTQRTEKTESGTRTSYEAVHSFEVRVHDTAKAGDVLDAAVSGGANRVDGVQFTLSDATRADLRQTAIRQAMRDARSQADAAANATGLSVRRVDHVSVGSSGVPVVYASAGSSSGAKTTLDGGDVTVTATVQVTYTAT